MTELHPADPLLLMAADGTADAAVADHVAGCDACRARVEALRRESRHLEALLATLDHARIAPRPAEALFRREAVRAARPTRRWLRVALAGGLSVATALAAAALPSSPVHRWLVGTPSAARPVAVPPPVGAALPPRVVPSAGVVIPNATTMIIVVQHPQASGVVLVTVGGDSVVRVAARGGDVAYDVSDSGVTIRNREPAVEYDIGLPRALGSAPIYVGSTRIYPTSLAPEADPIAGQRRYRIPLGVPRP